MLVNKLLVIGAIATIGFSMPALADSGSELAKRSHQLSVNMKHSAQLEQNDFCKTKLSEASAFAEEAKTWYLRDHTFLGRELMKAVSTDLERTSDKDCSEKLSITVHKQEADSIISVS